jgi:hypothetical protein
VSAAKRECHPTNLVVIFGVRGLLDFGWHRVFGFESGLGVLVSPSHLWLLIGVFVANLGILNASLVSRTQHELTLNRVRLVDIPVLLSFAALLRATLWTASYAAPLAVDYASGGAVVRGLPAFAGVEWLNPAAQVAGTTGVLLDSVVLAMFLTAAVRHLHIPTGGLIVLLLWDGTLTAATTGLWVYLPAVVVGALTGEVWLAYARHNRPGRNLPEFVYWVLAGSIPMAQSIAYFGMMAFIGGGIVWTAYLWTGTIVSAGLFELITSVLIVPPRWVTEAWNRQ